MAAVNVRVIPARTVSEDNRLTRADYAAIDDRVSERVGYLCGRSRNYQPEAWEWVRLAWHAIGCDDRDLRDVELALIERQVDAICRYYRQGVVLHLTPWRVPS